MSYIVLYFIVIILLYKRKFLYLNILLILLIGFRYNVGTDYWNYTNNFILQKLDTYELGFKYLNILVFKFTLNSQILLLISGMISIFFIWNGMKNYKIEKTILYFIYFCMYYIEPNFNLTRHGIAMSISYYALSLKNINKKLLFILLASLFQKVALILIFIVLFEKINIKLYLLLLLISIIFYFIEIDILRFLYENKLVFSEYLNWKIKFYMFTRKITINSITLGILYRFVLLIICLFNLKLFKSYKENLKILILSNIVFFLLAKNGIFYERIANLLYLFEINILVILFKNKNNIVKILILILATLFYLKIVFKENTALAQLVYEKKYKYIPYNMKLENKEIKFKWNINK